MAKVIPKKSQKTKLVKLLLVGTALLLLPRRSSPTADKPSKRDKQSEKPPLVDSNTESEH